ncbi:MAG TPA: radical SAM protein [Methanotrichaceae archaeon]|nr:radical SAM protein [Methanotrichaceae archaeon]
MLKFETSMGNKYAWEDDIGLFIPFSPIMDIIIKETSKDSPPSKDEIIEKLKMDFDISDIEYYYKLIKKLEQIKQNLIIKEDHKIDCLERSILKDGLNQLTLEVTEDCNFRCIYCIYSENYVYSRAHSKKYMNIDTAKKAIDHYFSLIKAGVEYNPSRKPSVAFYGGEPLLNFELIKECVEYIKDVYKLYEVVYSITTNGSLLNKERANWLMQNDFHIGVSISGPKAEHDRLRIYSNGNGTFCDIMENIRPIMDAGWDKIKSLVVIDWKTDLFKLEEFFSRNDVPPIASVSTVGQIEGCKYYDKFTKNDYTAFRNQLDQARIFYISKFRDTICERNLSFFGTIFGGSAVECIHRPSSIIPHSSLIPFTGACIPGKKIFVSADGNYYACERGNRGSPIGNNIEGIDFKKIKMLINNYINYLDKCPTCNMKRLCRKCYQNLTTDKCFIHTSKGCYEEEKSQKELLAGAFLICENCSEIAKKLLNEGNEDVFQT